MVEACSRRPVADRQGSRRCCPCARFDAGNFFKHLFKLFLKLTLFIFFFKSNTLCRVYSHGAANSNCRAMHGGTAWERTWQKLGPLTRDVAQLYRATDQDTAVTRHASWRGRAK